MLPRIAGRLALDLSFNCSYVSLDSSDRAGQQGFSIHGLARHSIVAALLADLPLPLLFPIFAWWMVLVVEQEFLLRSMMRRIVVAVRTKGFGSTLRLTGNSIICQDVSFKEREERMP
jgi:hypothetical protein